MLVTFVDIMYMYQLARKPAREIYFLIIRIPWIYLLGFLCNTLLGVFTLCLSLLNQSAGGTSLENSFSVLVQLQFDNYHI